MTEFEIDEEYIEEKYIEEVNTSYDQDKEIGSIPSAYFAYSQPMNAKNGDNFMSIQKLDEDRIVEEKLNKDGTGVKRATRGLNPKKTPAKVLQFVYVSKSECEICRQYDGMAFATDSPNRPIIPRLESQGKRGSRPYTHPNCKCKWVRPFSDAGIKNFDDMGLFNGDKTSLGYSGESIANELKQKTIDMARQTIIDFDKLSKRDQYVAIAYMFKQRLNAPESFDPTSLPIASMLKMTYDAIEPTLALRLAKMTHRDSNEVRELIDNIVGESLSSERKHEIVLEHNLDFTFENLLKLTVTALSEEHDVWDEDTYKLVDPSLLEDKKEGDEGEFGFTDDEWNHFPKEVQDQLTNKVFKKEGLDDEEPYMPDVYGIDPYPHRHEFIDNDCIICDYVLKASESDSSDYYGTYNIDGGAREDNYYYLYCLHCDKKVYINYDVKGSYDEMDEHVKVHFEEEGESKATEDDDHSCPTCPDKPYDCCCLYCDTDITQYGSYDCKNCGRTKGNMHYGESKATEDKYQPSEYDLFDDMGGQDNDPYLICKICKQRVNPEGTDWFATRVNHLNIHGIQNLNDVSDWLHANESKATEGAGCINCWGDGKVEMPDGTMEICSDCRGTGLENPWEATEGGRGSGRKGHQKWMLGAEADPEECPNCMIFTEKKNGNCQICGNSY